MQVCADHGAKCPLGASNSKNQMRVEYANEAKWIAHSAENSYKLGTRLELSNR